MAQTNNGVPNYEVVEFTSKNKRYCLCVFVLNEGERFTRQLEALRPYSDLLDILIADGGSTDGAMTPDGLRSRNVSALLVNKGSRGLSTQMRMAFDYALKRGYEGVVVVDGNGKDGMGALPLFVRRLDEGFDHIQGSRFLPGGQAIATPLIRLLALRLIHAPLISWASGFPYTDTTNGFRAYSRRLLDHPQVQVFRDVFQKYELHYYLSIRAAQLGLKVIEVPVTRAYPKSGKVPTKISPVRGYSMVFLTLLKAVWGCYDPR